MWRGSAEEAERGTEEAERGPGRRSDGERGVPGGPAGRGGGGSAAAVLELTVSAAGAADGQ